MTTAKPQHGMIKLMDNASDRDPAQMPDRELLMELYATMYDTNIKITKVMATLRLRMTSKKSVEIKDFLLEQLADDKKVSVADIKAEATRRGININSLNVNARRYGVVKIREGFGKAGKWFWQIPTVAEQYHPVIKMLDDPLMHACFESRPFVMDTTTYDALVDKYSPDNPLAADKLMEREGWVWAEPNGPWHFPIGDEAAPTPSPTPPTPALTPTPKSTKPRKPLAMRRRWMDNPR